jgi:ubiquinone/menaquinone biosynthesis C-methylase UbiE
MTLQEATQLIQHRSIGKQEHSRWADLGCGTGLFTFALAQLLQQGSRIDAVDKSPVALKALSNPNHITITTTQLDFIQQPLPFSSLNGILMANSLHYVADKPAFIARMKPLFGKEGCWLIVEYDTDRSTAWVPYPLSYHSLENLFTTAGYPLPEKLGEMPSAYRTGNLYAALIKNAA